MESRVLMDLIAVSLFTNVPLDPTLDFLKRKLPSIQSSLLVSVPCLIDLIRLTSSFSVQSWAFDRSTWVLEKEEEECDEDAGWYFIVQMCFIHNFVTMLTEL